MAEETHDDVQDVDGGNGERRIAEVLPVRRVVWSLAVALATLALLLTVFHGAPLASLPAYPAVILAFVVAIVVPGLILQRALLVGGHVDLPVRVAVASALGLGLAAVPGLIALELHLDLQAFASMHATVAGAACGLSMLVSSDQARGPAQRDAGASGGALLLATMVGVVLAGVVTTPFWASGRIAGDFDDWTYAAYVREFVDTDRMNAEEPFLGTGESVNPRMRSNVWVAVQALVADTADVPPHDVLFEYLPPLMTALAVLAMYAFTRSLFRSTTVGLLAAAFLLGYAFLDLAPHEGMGRNLLLRISEDKMVAGFVLLPIALLFLSRFAASASRAAFAGFALVVLALMVVHPVLLVFLAIPIVCFGAVRAWTERTPKVFSTVGLLLTPVALASIWPFLQRQLLVDVAPQVFEATALREEFRLVRLGAGLVIGNYHMLLHPLMLAAIVLAPLMWLGSRRRRIGNQLVVAMTAGAMLTFFVPPFAMLLAKMMAPQTLWRVPWMVPVAPILAYATYEAALRLGQVTLLGRLGSRLAMAAAPAVIMVLVLAGALVVQEQYVRLDNDAFYDWTSRDSSIAGTEMSIFLGGLDRAFSAESRLEPLEEDLFEYIAGSIPQGSVVLVEPRDLGHKMVGVLTDIYPVDPGGRMGWGERRRTVVAFEGGRLSGSELEAAVDLYGIDYIAARELDPSNQAVRSFSRAQFQAEIGPYQVYQVIP